MEAALEAEEVRNVGELEIRLNEEHKEEVKQLHKTLLEKVRVIPLLGTFHLSWDGGKWEISPKYLRLQMKIP